MQVGSPAAFTADVADASGDWSWTATVPPDDAVGTGTTTGSFTTDSIPKGATSILISLKVGTSDSLTLRFDVDQIEISTTTTVTYLPPPDGGTAFWTIDEITPVVNVADTAGTNVTTGTVRLTATSSSGAAVTGGDQTVELVGGEATFTALRTDTPGDLTMAVEYDGDSTHSPSGGSAVANVFQTPKEVYQGVCPLYSMEFTPDTNGADMRVTLSVDSGGSLEMTYLGPGTNAPNSSAYVHFPPYSPGEGFTAGVFDPSTQRTIQLTGNMPHGCVG